MALMKKNDLPDWFPLERYSKKHTDDNWLCEIAFRLALQSLHDKHNDGDGKDATVKTIQAFNDVVINNEIYERKFAKTPVSNFRPVRNPMPFELLFCAQWYSGENHSDARLWAKRLYDDPQKWLASFYDDEIREKLLSGNGEPEHNNGENDDAPYYNDIIGKCAPVWVDLDHDDDTLKLAFSVWLTSMRNVLNEKSKQIIGEKEFEKWKRFKLLEAFDLKFWSDINKLGYTDAYIAKRLWPDFSNDEDFVDVTERYRKVTKPLLKEVFNGNYLARFWRQVEFSHAMESIISIKKAEQESGKVIPE